MKLIAFEVESWEADAFETLGDRYDCLTTRDPMRSENVGDYADAEIISTFINSKLGADVLGQFDDLKMIATRSTGFDHIDLDHCREQGITVCNVPTYGTNTVAEHVFALLLALSHKIEHAVNRTRKGDFSSRGLQGFDLHGKTLGVIGTGDIGCAAIRIARGFDMNVLGYDVKPDESTAEKFGFEYVPLERLLERSDVITIHVPGSEKTRHLIGGGQFDRMKEGAVVINTARGEVVDIQALVRALAEGRVAGAGLDVLPEEPVIREEAELLRSVYEREHDLDTLLANHVLLHLTNVIVTPHSAFNTREAVQRILDTTVENIERFADGDPQNVVTG
ncbi:MAG: hydroxyacid dehydrogenase [Planctomycetota bacterium]|nr:hydroxyacid dehydrogenase [Planctomycetota bacterium]